MSCFTGSRTAAAGSRDVADRAQELYWVNRLLTVDMVIEAMAATLQATNSLGCPHPKAFRDELVALMTAAFNARDNS